MASEAEQEEKHRCVFLRHARDAGAGKSTLGTKELGAALN
jgi:hypothetical protein